MSTSGPGPSGPGPDVVHEAEAARRRLYAPGGRTPEALDEYDRLRTAAAATPPIEEHATGRGGGTAAGAPAAEPPQPRRRRRRLAVAVTVAAAGVAVLVLAVVGTRPALPASVPLPSLPGTGLFAYARAEDPATGPGSITYQPEGYTSFDPRGRVVAVALRCVGRGTVRISAGAQFDFRCTDRERTIARRDLGPRTRPFVIVGTTVGDVVWAARIVLLDPPQTAGAIPSFRDSCPGCIPIGEPS